MKIQIHNYSNGKGGERIGPRKFKEVIDGLSQKDYIFDDTEQSNYQKRDILQIIITEGAGLSYSYYSGIGSFPNEREEINAFGQFDKISKLCEILREKGLPVKSITFENTKL
jgi:hypothetical protein